MFHWKQKVPAFLTLLALFTVSPLLKAQRFLSDSSSISFFSEALLEDIAATNSQGKGLIDVSTMEFAFSVSIKEFQFEKSLMQEHFNEDYMESEKHPKASFSGKMLGFSPEVKVWQEVTAEGELAVHGVKRKVSLPALILIKNAAEMEVKASFNVLLKDYKIKVPRMLFQNIAETIRIDTFFTFSPYDSK